MGYYASYSLQVFTHLHKALSLVTCYVTAIRLIWCASPSHHYFGTWYVVYVKSIIFLICLANRLLLMRGTFSQDGFLLTSKLMEIEILGPPIWRYILNKEISNQIALPPARECICVTCKPSNWRRGQFWIPFWSTLKFPLRSKYKLVIGTDGIIDPSYPHSDSSPDSIPSACCVCGTEWLWCWFSSNGDGVDLECTFFFQAARAFEAAARRYCRCCCIVGVDGRSRGHG